MLLLLFGCLNFHDILSDLKWYFEILVLDSLAVVILFSTIVVAVRALLGFNL